VTRTCIDSSSSRADRRREDQPRAASCAVLRGQLVLEQAEQNPFLSASTKAASGCVSDATFSFLFQRARQLEEVRQQDLFGAVRIADYLLEKDGCSRA